MLGHAFSPSIQELEAGNLCKLDGILYLYSEFQDSRGCPIVGLSLKTKQSNGSNCPHMKSQHLGGRSKRISSFRSSWATA